MLLVPGCVLPRQNWFPRDAVVSVPLRIVWFNRGKYRCRYSASWIGILTDWCDTTWCHQAFLSVVISIMLTYAHYPFTIDILQTVLSVRRRLHPLPLLVITKEESRDMSSSRYDFSSVNTNARVYLKMSKMQSACRYLLRFFTMRSIVLPCSLRFFYFAAMFRRWRRENRVFGIHRWYIRISSWPPQHNICHEEDSRFSRRKSCFERLDIRPSWQ